MTKTPASNPPAMQTQSMAKAMELVDDPMPPMPVPRPRSYPFVDIATSQVHRLAHTRSSLRSRDNSRAERDDRGLFADDTAAEDDRADERERERFRAYHYFDSAYPDHSLRVEYSDDPRYPAGEYPEGAYPTDAYLADDESGSEQFDGHDDDDDDDEGLYLDPPANFLYDDDEDSADEGWGSETDEDEDESAAREFADTRDEQPTTKAGDEARDTEGLETDPDAAAAAAAAATATATPPKARAQGDAGDINLHHHIDAPQTPNLVRHAVFAAAACVGLMYAWNWALNRPRQLPLWNDGEH
ncbi:uncharacterized protein PV07_08254 [Cladophialophora immunda]|uniref:Uncharacterized protein n=1 Tax=Cladophialophora immunda TaxID=569365 RepID=A0A0D2CYF0_9EURO|nr:uncharacterized protein PV07_08254 [Cladophialophora immunda]KIW28604.1 hypothetical protein PV07_08254 [Cladophialophora immunda]